MFHLKLGATNSLLTRTVRHMYLCIEETELLSRNSSNKHILQSIILSQFYIPFQSFIFVEKISDCKLTFNSYLLQQCHHFNMDKLFGISNNSSNSCIAFLNPFRSRYGLTLFSSNRASALDRTGFLKNRELFYLSPYRKDCIFL